MSRKVEEARGLSIILGVVNSVILFPMSFLMLMLNYNIWELMGRGMTVVDSLRYDEDDERPPWRFANCRSRLFEGLTDRGESKSR